MKSTIEKTELMRQIRDEILHLKKSPLYEYRTKNKYFPVIGEGDHDTDIVFIGEAPGLNEAKQGRPFCGAAGKVLDKLLASADIARSEVYITNIVKDRPPENRDPTPEEIALYAPFLDRQLEIIKPKVIVTLGRFSMEYIMKKYGLDLEMEPISKAHGKKFDAKAGEHTMQIVPLYHPATALYNGSFMKVLEEDFEILKQFHKKYDKKTDTV